MPIAKNPTQVFPRLIETVAERYGDRGLFDAFLGTAAGDRRNRTAIVDNPLVPFGGVDR